MAEITLDYESYGTPCGLAELGGREDGVFALLEELVVYRTAQIVVVGGIERGHRAAECEGAFGGGPVSGIVVNVVCTLILVLVGLPRAVRLVRVVQHEGYGAAQFFFKHGDILGSETGFVLGVNGPLVAHHPGIFFLEFVAAAGEEH